MDRGVVDVLFEHDPAFVRFAKTVVGVDNTDDFLAVVRDNDFSKMSPCAPDGHVPGSDGGASRPASRKRKRLVRVVDAASVSKVNVP